MNTLSKTNSATKFSLKRLIRITIAHIIRASLMIVPIFAIIVINNATRESMISPTYEGEILLKVMIIVADLMLTAILVSLSAAGASLKINKR